MKIKIIFLVLLVAFISGCKKGLVKSNTPEKEASVVNFSDYILQKEEIPERFVLFPISDFLKKQGIESNPGNFTDYNILESRYFGINIKSIENIYFQSLSRKKINNPKIEDAGIDVMVIKFNSSSDMEANKSMIKKSQCENNCYGLSKNNIVVLIDSNYKEFTGHYTKYKERMGLEEFYNTLKAKNLEGAEKFISKKIEKEVEENKKDYNLNKDIDCYEYREGLSQNSCFGYSAKLNNDKSLCRYINSEIGRNICYQKFYSNNILNCNLESLIVAKDNCYYGSTIGKMINFCDKINDNKLRDKCYFDLAIKGGDQTFCEDINDRDRKTICLENADCNKHTDRMKKINCFSSKGLLTLDVSYCKYVGDDVSSQAVCYATIAELSLNPELCANTSDSDMCYLIIAPKFYGSEKNICQKINDKTKLQYCLDKIERSKKDGS